MARYIDAEKLELEVRDGAIKLDGAWFFIGRSGKDLAHLALAINSVIQNAPAEDVAPVRHGHWIEQVKPVRWCEDDLDIFYECSVCHCIDPGEPNYCPECGAKMDEEVE